MHIRFATVILLAATSAGLLGGCAAMPDVSLIETAAIAKPDIAKTDKAEPARGTPVVAGRPARVYIMAGFKEADCSPLAPDIKVTTPPGKGEISLRPGQKTSLQHSLSGKCTGKEMAGTGIYYTARQGETGPDTFTVTATSASGATTTRTFALRIVE